MGKKTADDVARELLFATKSERDAHAVAVQALLVRNASFRTNDELIEEQLRADPAFRSEWRRTALARAVVMALVRYRAEHDLSQRELADRLRMTRRDIAGLEVGDVDPSQDTLNRISIELGIVLTTELRNKPGSEASARRMIAVTNTCDRSEPVR
jgi:ribosome-binding protein aMBF1 (putative translation factor)